MEYQVETTLDYLAKKHYGMDFKDLCGPRQKTIQGLAEIEKCKHEQEQNSKEV